MEASRALERLTERALQKVGGACFGRLDADRPALGGSSAVKENRVAERQADGAHHQAGGEQQGPKPERERSAHGITLPQCRSRA